MHSGYIPDVTKVVSVHSAPVAILWNDTEASMTTLLSQEAPMDNQNEHEKIYDAKFITIPTGTKSQVAILTSKCVLMTMKRMQMEKPT